MFLAINEIKHSKLRYFLVIGVMFLIAYLVFFLTGLAYGLAQDNRTAIDKWQADNILIAEEANDRLAMSMITRKAYNDVEADEKAELAQTPVVISKKSDSETINATIFAINKDQFLVPNVTEGNMFAKDDETVVDDSLRERYGLKVGDVLKLSGSDTEITITGFTDKAKISVGPVLYLSIETYQKIRFEKEDTSDNARINAVVTKGNVSKVPDGLSKVPIANSLIIFLVTALKC